MDSPFSRVLLTLILLLFTNWNMKCTDGYEVEDSNPNVSSSNNNGQGSSPTPPALTVARAIADFGKTFHYGIIGELNKVKEVDGKEKVGFLMKKLPFIKHLPSLAMFFGGIGTLLSVVLSVIPRDSPELAFMKKSFSEVNRKLDVITNSLQETKSLVKEYSQKAAYIRAENNIIQAYKKVDLAVSDMLNVTCSGAQDCKVKKMRLVADIIGDLNVRKDLEMIYQGVTKSSVFGASLLDLITESTGCDISKIEHFVSTVGGLLAKGAAATAFYDLFKKHNYDRAEDLKQFQSLMISLEKKKEKTTSACYKMIDNYIVSDVYDKSHNPLETIRKTNEKFVQFLSVKYPWIPFYAVTINSAKYPLYWTNENIQKNMNAKDDSKKSNLKTYVFIGSNNRVENHDKKLDRFKSKLKTNTLSYMDWFTHKFNQGIDKFHKSVRNDKYLHNQFRALLIVPEYEEMIIGYKGVDNSVKQVNPKQFTDVDRKDLFVFQQCRKNLICASWDKPVYVIATVKSVDNKIFDCTKECSANGRCNFLPYTKTMRCKCVPHYFGETCNQSISDIKMAADLSKLLDISFKIPSLFDVSLQLKDVQIALQADIGNIKNAILTMDKKLNTIFGTLNKELMTSFDWHGLITQYGKIVRDLKYYYHILIEKSDVCRKPTFLEIMDLKCDFQKEFITKEKIEFAKEILKPNGLRRHLHYLSYLFFGRQDISLVSHKPLLFQTMEKHRRQICSAEYKSTLDRAYKQLLMLQFQGYVVWIHALKYIDYDTGFVAERYKEQIQKQQKFYDSNTCNVVVDNSVNFKNCSKGYYLYRGMKEDVVCADTFYLKKKESTSLYVKDVIRVSSQQSNDRSSAKMITGAPDVYPNYGDNSKAWSPNQNSLSKPQFIEVAFKDALIIRQIMIYETFHGGAVKRIEGFHKTLSWKSMWETDRSNIQDIENSRIFTLSLTQQSWSTSRLKITIDSSVTKKAFQIDAVQIKGSPVEGTCLWYESLSCVACECDITGSTNQKCSSSGNCVCKSGFEGKKCDLRHCAMTQWSAWTACECGPGKTKTRHRSVQHTSYGAGRPCGQTSQTEDCNIQCVCNHGDWGDFCEKQNCLVSSWGAWEGCPYQERHACDKAPVINHVYRRRHVTRRNNNLGHACPSLQDRKACPVPKCKHSYAAYG